MKNIYKIFRLSTPLHKYFVFLSLMLLVVAVLNQSSPIMLKLIVDEAQKQIATGNGDINALYRLIILMFVLAAARMLMEALGERLGDFIASRLRKFLTEIFYKKIFTLPQSYFDKEISGKIVNQLVRGIQTIQDFVNTASNFILPALLQSAFTIAILFYFSPIVGALALAIFPIYIYISRYSTKRWGVRQEKKNYLEDVSRGRIQEVLSNIKLIKSFNTQNKEWNFVSDKLVEINQIYDKQSTEYHLLNLARNTGLEVVLIIVVAIIFTSTFNSQLSFGDTVMILQFLNQVRWPLFGMSFILERVQQAESGSKEFFEVLDLPSEEYFNEKDEEEKKLLEIKTPNIKFENVTFKYDETTPVLENVSFEIKPKETVALVGHSGAGKTTLINLILKFYNPNEGEIYIGDHAYKELDHRDVRNNISLVFQENELLSTSIRENVAYGIKDATEEQIVDALKKANAYDFVMAFKDKLDTEIGERGVRLSGGQKQRLQIARALMHDKPILILDEATSSLDAKSEKLVQDAIDNLVKDRLVIVIAHRFSTIQNADRIIVLEKGGIADTGTPGELAKREGIYSELLKYQIDGNKKLLEKYDLF